MWRKKQPEHHELVCTCLLTVFSLSLNCRGLNTTTCDHSERCLSCSVVQFMKSDLLHLGTPYLKLLGNKKRHIIPSTMLDQVHTIGAIASFCMD